MKIVNGIETEETLEELAQRAIDEEADIVNIQQNIINRTNLPIIHKLNVLDLKSIRALREGNPDRLKALEDEAIELRKGLIK